jgi:putative heme degradation protein
MSLFISLCTNVPTSVLNPLDYDPTYPKNPTNLAQYIRKYRKDKGLFIRELAQELGIAEFMLINWEVRGGMPRYKSHIRRLSEMIPGAGRFL